jgi:L-alanine-DL-glutamate epimerase-like enolase superfamily enzyme
VKLSVHPYFLEFIHPFALAHGTRSGTQLAFVKLEHNGMVAYGEASLPPYRKETLESVTEWVKKQQEQVLESLSLNPFEHVNQILFSAEHPSAAAALQSAILNWYVQANQTRLTDYFEQTNNTPKLTLTITKNDFPFIEEKLRLTEHFSHFKIKLTGANDDLEFVQSLRAKTSLPFCIDINQGYQNREDAIRLITDLEKQHCILIEQPLKDTDHEGHYWLKQRTKLPIVADESICQYNDLVQNHEAYSGVNVKLMKCGGLLQAQQMLHFKPANEPNFIKLIGCMSESSLGVSMAAVLASQCQMADLDAPYLNKNNPFKGFSIVNGKIVLADKVELNNVGLF